MFELLFLVAVVSWALIGLLQSLAGLPAAPALLAAAVVTPPLAWWRARCLARTGRIGGPDRGRRTLLPPEIFYWPATRRWLGRRTIGAAAAAAMACPVVFAWPASGENLRWSPAGWTAAAAAVAALAETAAGLWLYVRTSQRFNRQAPCLIGWLRRGLYRLSDNHEFLAEEPLPREKPARESVY